MNACIQLDMTWKASYLINGRCIYTATEISRTALNNSLFLAQASHICAAIHACTQKSKTYDKHIAKIQDNSRRLDVKRLAKPHIQMK